MTKRVGRIEEMDEPRPTRSALVGSEIARLTATAKGQGRFEGLPNAMFGAAFCGFLAFGIPYWLWKQLAPVDRPQDHKAYFVGLGAAVALYVLVSLLRALRSWTGYVREQARKACKDLAGGVAHQFDLAIARAVEIEEHEDEGTGFFLELADGRVLCLISQDLYEYASDFELEAGAVDRRNAFPQTRIRYRYAPHCGMLLDLAGTGEPLRPFALVKTTGRFFKKDKQTGQRSYTGPEDGMVYEGPLEATLAAFKYKSKPL
jgi:hypothetical protein